jgi:hypothetical protein
MLAALGLVENSSVILVASMLGEYRWHKQKPIWLIISRNLSMFFFYSVSYDGEKHDTTIL